MNEMATENTNIMGSVDPDFKDMVVRDDKPELVSPVTFLNGDVDEKLYLILEYDPAMIDYDLEARTWRISIGRQATFDELKNAIMANDLDPDMSFIISGDQKFEDAITVYRFMRLCIDNGSVLHNDEEFDLDCYHNIYKLNGDLSIKEACDIIDYDPSSIY